MSKYELINPIILGNLDTSFNNDSPNNVALEVWNVMSSYFTGNVPRFAFTLKDSNNKLYHYSVKEKITKGKNVEISIKPIYLNLEENQNNRFIKHIEKLKQKNCQIGGKSKKRYKNDDDDSDSDSDYIDNKLIKHKRNNDPFYYWWYNPIVYTYSDIGYNSLYIPTFSIPYYPYFEIDVSSAFFS